MKLRKNEYCPLQINVAFVALHATAITSGVHQLAKSQSRRGITSRLIIQSGVSHQSREVQPAVVPAIGGLSRSALDNGLGSQPLRLWPKALYPRVPRV